MVRAINDVGHEMGKKTIGESVDGEAGLGALRRIGVDFAQGHWISPPSPFLTPVPAKIPVPNTAPDSVRAPQLDRLASASVLDSAT
jgi:EAL domain-containing protein (putative c-di-GMP-specific phosphodiesterase class I)